MTNANKASQPVTKHALVLQFVRAITTNATAALSGAASIVLLFLGVTLKPDQYKNAVFLCAGFCILWAVYRVWADERKHVLALNEDHRQLQQHANETREVLAETQKELASHIGSIDAYKNEIAQLRTRPFDEGQKTHARTLIGRLDYMQRDLLRFLLLRGSAIRSDVLSSAGSMADSNLQQLSMPLISLGLINRAEDHLSGYPTFSIARGMDDVLKDLLFPRQETNQVPYFDGIPVTKNG